MPTRVKKRRRSPLLSTLMVLVLMGAAFLIWRLAFASPQPSGNLPDWVTEKLLPINPYSRPGDPLEQVNGVVVHYVGNPGTTAEQNNSYFKNLATTGETYASSHFLIGLDGEILCNVPLDEIAYCTGPRNVDTISIECCHPDDTGAFTQATYDSLIKLVRWLMDEYRPGGIVRFIGQLLRYPVSNDTGKERQTMEFELRYVNGHIEVYDAAGLFRFSADSRGEALAELEDMAA